MNCVKKSLLEWTGLISLVPFAHEVLAWSNPFPDIYLEEMEGIVKKGR